MTKRKKLNAVDLIIATSLMVLITVFAKYYLYFPGSFLAEKATPVTLIVSVVTDDIDEGLSKNIRRGDIVSDAESGSFAGCVEALETKIYMASSEHFSDERPVPERVFLKMELRCEALKSGDYYIIGDKKVIIGETYSLCVPELYFEAECISVNEEIQSGGFREILPRLAIE